MLWALQEHRFKCQGNCQGVGVPRCDGFWYGESLLPDGCVSSQNDNLGSHYTELTQVVD